ncbi:Rid family detoxifying hydrolase [Anaerococcus prevotii]|uniref:Putative endoribonuclease L-PSP n=1 Tax=Anaerococcus prevotii ACS-065-V-Col13 TaxID=879305 RepID=F0GTC0_9FIRM|nr:Rid family detoxifying hydrolase [Anaerococcus prevotii]EGC82962.1 putative endoribonuclease L-PSP [Anaerococcus prevotii ACS-065-V-Col13]MDU5149765.1 Rid family detoxifying hydrolase [Anaerococcus prevotii]
MKSINTNDAPKAVGAYVQGIATDSLVFTSGQLPLDPKTGELVTEIKAATKQALSNVEAILKEAGSGKDKVIKCVVYLNDINNFKAFDEVYAEFFADHKPARSAFEVANLPKDGLLEIEAIASL